MNVVVLGWGSAVTHVARRGWGCADVRFGIGHCVSCWSRMLGEATLNEQGDLTKAVGELLDRRHRGLDLAQHRLGKRRVSELFK
jgi:hypothetical protein